MTIVRISTDWQARYHVQADADVADHDCYQVELPPYTLNAPILVHREGANMAELWNEALRTLDALRSQPREPVLPATRFLPFGVITLRRREDVWREHELRREMMLGACTDRERERIERIDLRYAQEMHERRVASLCRAVDLLNGAPPPVVVPFPDIPVRH